MHSSVTAAITNTGSGSYETAVPRSLVHRLAVSEVYLMTAEQLGVDQFHLTAQWPRRHFYYRVADCSVDPMLVAETLRQSTILVAHRYYEVPLTRRFLMRRMTVSLAGGDIVASVRPAEIVLKVGVDRMRSGPNGVTRMRTNIEFWFQDNLIAEGMGDLQVVNARVYERMRSGSQSSEWLTLAAYAGGGKKPSAQGVVLNRSGSGPAWQLVIDYSHPVFFDHPVDHLPGMLIMESARQAAAEVVGIPSAEFTYFDGRYDRFLDLGNLTTIRLERWTPSMFGGGEGQFTLSQHETTAVAVRVAVSA